MKLESVYPYTYVRVTTMKAKLLKKEDYDKLLKMSFAEISRYLQESEYKQDINQFALDLKGADLLEAALNNNLITTFNKLKRISPDELDLLIDAYVKRYDYFNIKTIIRGRFAKLENEKIKSMLKPLGNVSLHRKLCDEASIENILLLSGMVEKKLIPAIMKEFSEKNNLMAIEEALDKSYFTYVFDFAETIPKQGELFKKFLLTEVDIVNIKALLRLKKEKATEKEVEQHIYMFGSEISTRKIKNMVTMDYESLLREIQKTSFKNIIKKHIPTLTSKGSLTEFENDLNKHLLKKTSLMLHQHPLTIDIILGYMFAKEIEVMNLYSIIKGKQLEMGNEFIEKQLIIA